MIVGNWYITYSIARRVSRHMRMLVDLCLTSVDVEQRGDKTNDTMFYVVCYRPSITE